MPGCRNLITRLVAAACSQLPYEGPGCLSGNPTEYRKATRSVQHLGKRLCARHRLMQFRLR